MDSNGRLRIRWIYSGWVTVALLLQLLVRAPALTLSALALLAVLTGLLFPDYIDDRFRFRRLGYSVTLTQARVEECLYQEKAHGQLSFPVRRPEENTLVISVPSAEDWPLRTPNWARQRRREILGRITEDLSESFVVSFDYLNAAPEFPTLEFEESDPQDWEEDAASTPHP
jgi:hypothetical protein